MNSELLVNDDLQVLIKNVLYEDVKDGDITTNNVISIESKGEAYIYAKSMGVVSGLPVAEMVFKQLDENIEWINHCKDGDTVNKGEKVASVKGSYRALLTGERVALNFLQRMSGIATETNKFVEVLKPYNTELLDTRKTVPGLRMLDKYAVSCGGGTNHRIGLFDMVMLKENHIMAAGGIKKAMEMVKPKISNGIKIEVETTNFNEVKEALENGADIIMLDNMSTEEMKEAVEFINGRVKVEASGNMTIERLKEVAETGVDFISVGKLTHSIKALDLSMLIEGVKK